MFDTFIEEELKNNPSFSDYDWMSNTISLSKSTKNQFEEKEFDYLYDSPDILKNPIANLFNSYLHDMDIRFDYLNMQPDESKIDPFLNMSLGILFPKIKNDGNNIQRVDNTKILENQKSLFMKNLKVQVDCFESDFAFIEPIICSAILYNKSEKKFISQPWYFYPFQSQSLFEKGNEYVSLNSVSFLLDPSQITNDVVLIVLFMHPTTVGNGEDVIKYYLDHSQKNMDKAKAQISKSYPRLKDCFSTFAITSHLFQPFLKENSKIKLSPPFVFQKPIVEELIPNYFDELLHKKGKQIQISLILKNSQTSSGIKRPLRKTNHYPYFSLFHQMCLKLETIIKPSQLKSKDILIKIELKDGANSLEYFISKFNPNKLVSEVYSSCWYHETSPQYNDFFTLNLPYPITLSMKLVFSVYNVSIKNQNMKNKFVGKSEFNLIDISNSGNTFVKDGTYSSPIILESGEESKASISFTIQTCSNLISKDECFEKYKTCLNDNNDIDINLINSIQVPELIDNLIFMFDSLCQGINQNQQNIINGFLMLQEKLIPLIGGNNFEQYFLLYVQYFALHGDFTKFNDFHSKLINSLNKYFEVGNSITSLIFCIRGFFRLYIKSLILFNGDIIDNQSEIESFMNNWTKVFDLSSNQTLNELDSLSEFIYFLFDIHYYDIALQIFKSQNSKFTDDNPISKVISSHFLTRVFQPKLFYFSLKFNPEFRSLILENVKSAYSQSNVNTKILGLLIQLFKFYPKDMLETISTTFYEILLKLEIPPSKISQLQLCPTIFILFVILNVKPVSFLNLRLQDENLLFNVIMAILQRLSEEKKKNETKPNVIIGQKSNSTSRKERSKTLRLKSPASLIGISHEVNAFKSKIIYNANIESYQTQVFYRLAIFIKNFLQNYPKNGIDNIVKLLYYLLKSKINRDTQNILCMDISMLFNLALSELLKLKNPSFIEIFGLIFTFIKQNDELVQYIMMNINDFYKSFNQNEYQTFSLILHITNELNNEVITSNNFESLCNLLISSNNKHFIIFGDILKRIVNNARKMNENNSTERKAELLLEKALLYKYNPNCLINILEELESFHEKNNQPLEAAFTIVIEDAIILEYSTYFKRIQNIFNLNHPCLVFEKIISLVQKLILPNDAKRSFLPIFKYDDSYIQFNLLSENLQRILKLTKEAKSYELSQFLINIYWPLYESERAYLEISSLFSTYSGIFKEISTYASSDPNRLFKVTFYGDGFGEENGKTYIYREKRLTHLYDFTNKILDSYRGLYGKDKIELLTENIIPEQSDKLYIHIIFTEPYQKKNTQGRLQYFYFDTPFVKGSNQAQGSASTQWIRRTILKTDFELPYILQRAFVKKDEIKTIEYEPIKVSYHQIKERTELLKKSIQNKDFQKIQQLLHGSLLVQVNEGPAKIAETFLSGERNKMTKKLAEAFKKFIEINELGVKVHGHWVTSNTSFVPLQQQLESGLSQLKERIKTVILNNTNTPQEIETNINLDKKEKDLFTSQQNVFNIKDDDNNIEQENLNDDFQKEININDHNKITVPRSESIPNSNSFLELNNEESFFISENSFNKIYEFGKNDSITSLNNFVTKEPTSNNIFDNGKGSNTIKFTQNFTNSQNLNNNNEERQKITSNDIFSNNIEQEFSSKDPFSFYDQTNQQSINNIEHESSQKDKLLIFNPPRGNPRRNSDAHSVYYRNYESNNLVPKFEDFLKIESNKTRQPEPKSNEIYRTNKAQNDNSIFSLDFPPSTPKTSISEQNILQNQPTNDPFNVNRVSTFTFDDSFIEAFQNSSNPHDIYADFRNPPKSNNT